MTRTAVFVACMEVGCLGVAPQLAAEPVMITSGSMVFSESGPSQAGPISIFGTRGFSIQGVVDAGEGRVDPLNCSPCEPQQNFSVGAFLGGFAIIGDATLDGTVYRDINGLTSPALAFLHLGGLTELPPVQESSLVITAPFTVLNGSYFQFLVTPGSDSEPSDLARVLLRGGGTVTLALSPYPTAPVWELNHVRYDFQPIPEPATLVLVGGSLGGVLFGRGMRRIEARGNWRIQHSEASTRKR